MSSKKSKKKTKPHPTPTVLDNPEEYTEIVQEKIELPLNLEDKSTIETSYEISVAEVKSEDAAPKKPKRNRGKNKKQDKEEDLKEENKQKETGKHFSDILISEDVVNVSNLDIKSDEKDNLDNSNNKCLECETVTPTIRKKKNKKKDNKPNMENLFSEIQTTSSLKENESFNTDEKIAETVKLPIIESAKKSNKKNKKKKRNDSETSDKVEIVSDTTSFQISTESIDEKSKIGPVPGPLDAENVIFKDPLLTDCFLKQNETNSSEEILKIDNDRSNTFKEEFLLPEESSKQEFHESIVLRKEDNKNKEAEKEDKTQSKEVTSVDNKGQEQVTNLIPIQTQTCINEKILKNQSQDNNKTVFSSILDPDIEVIDNESAVGLKSKSIMAKPVEKKRKGKQQHHEVKDKEVEVLDHKNNKNKSLHDDNVTTKGTEEDSKSKDSSVSEDIKAQNIHSVDKDLMFTQNFELIKASDNIMGKKRKKSPKSPKLVIPQLLVHKEKSQDKEVFESNIKLAEDGEKSDIGIKTEVVSQIEPNTDNNKSSPEPKSKKKGKKSSKVPLTPGVIDFNPTFDTYSKTPIEEVKASVSDKTAEYKISSTEVTTGNICEPPFSSITVGHDGICIEKDITDIPFIDSEGSVKITSAASINTMENITSESMKTEVKLSEMKESHMVTDNCTTDVKTPILDIIPDIHYPRSTSQENDTNNNTVIREVRSDELQLPSVKDTPVIQGSGETPIGTPQMIVSDIMICEVPDMENLTEKTDIKSKMLEVNRDMEELRMSIERSLAEFTTLEKNEEKIEKEYEDKMNKGMVKTEIDLVSSSKSETANIEIEIKEYIGESSVTELEIESAIKPKETAVNKLGEDLSFQKKDTEPLQVLGKQKSDKISIENPESSKVYTDNIEAVVVVPETHIKEKIEIDKKQETPETKHSGANQPIYPPRKDNKSKNKKKRGKQEVMQPVQPLQGTIQATSENTAKGSSDKKNEKSETTKKNSSNSQEENKQKANTESPETLEASPNIDNKPTESITPVNIDFEPIENFEDALTSSTEEVDINKSFDMIIDEENLETQRKLAENKPEIKIIGPDEKPKEKITPPKNLLGSPNIPVSSNKTDYKKEKNKTPNTKQAKVKIKDSVDIELDEKSKTSKEQTNVSDTINNLTEDTKNIGGIILDNQVKENHLVTKENGDHLDNEKDDKPFGQKKEIKLFHAVNNKVIKSENIENRKSTESQTENKMSKTNLKNKDSLTQLKENEEFVYKYSFRKVFLQNACNVCKKELKLRVPCNFCNLLFYCSNKHKDEDWPQHQALCFAISTIGHLKDQKYIYADTKNITGQNYRLFRMQMILSCEKVLKRRLVPWEQELLLYPRICAEVSCRQWKQTKLKDCEGCGQISYCTDKPEHLPKTHQRWCKSYSLYQKLVIHQQTKGRLEPKMPTKVMLAPYRIPDKINEVLASIYEEKINMNDVQYAALTQLATAPLTAVYGHQIYTNEVNLTTQGTAKKSAFIIHVVGAELQFEADALNKWEVFFLHLRPDVQELKVILISTNLNPSNLPLDLLGNVKHCEHCRASERRVTFCFQDKKKYAEYKESMDYCYPDLVCAFNPSIQRSSVYKDLDAWPSTINSILRTKAPFIITAYTISELLRDLLRIKECADIDYKVISEAKYNSFASVRPDRNFITDDEMPLLFKNYCFMIICGC